MIAVGFALVNLVATHLIGPRRPNPVKLSPYESGVPAIGDARLRFSIKFYLVAMLFIIFDIEVVFLYPWGIVFRNLATGSDLRLLFLGRVLFFILTTIIAFLYAWRKGVFRYD